MPSSTQSIVICFAIVLVLTVVLTPSAPAQTFTVLHSFTCYGDGCLPETGLTIDAAGNLYGTTAGGGAHQNGTVFRLRKSGSGWVLNPLYSFAGGNDGASPGGRVSLAPDGSLYGTTSEGGGSGCNGAGCGTVFHLKPSPTAPTSALAPWSETVLYRFSGGSDGARPGGDLTFDKSGNIYGTASVGGNNNYGVVYELTPSGGGWTETALYSPQGSGGGTNPSGGVVFDTSGNLYGVFFSSGLGWGTVYQLSPAGSGWTEQTIHRFSYTGSDGADPIGGLIIDASGNLYGTTSQGETSVGTVFELNPGSGGWTFNTLWPFPLQNNSTGPVDKLLMDAAGNLYGTTFGLGVYNLGTVFKLTPSNGGWTYSSLHDFTGGSDGLFPWSSLVFDANGNIYGTTTEGGAGNGGVVFEITP
jgi:uncharacterized repeat protein (TIGR03803 family)